MSQQPSPPGFRPSGKTSSTGAVDLVRLARQAFDKGRRSNSLALTQAILAMDPQNEDALELQARIQAGLEKDLLTVRGLIRDAGWSGNHFLYQRAQALLSQVLEINPDLEEANTLLEEVASRRSVSSDTFTTKPQEQNKGSLTARSLVFPIVLSLAGLTVAVGVWATSNGWFQDWRAQAALSGLERVPSGAAPAANVDESAMARLDLFVVPGSGVDLSIDGQPFAPVPSFTDIGPGSHTLEFRAVGYEPHVTTVVVSPGERRLTAVVLDPISSSTPPAPPPQTAAGSAATTPPPPTQPPSQATTPPVVPEVSLQINARPWAEVFLDGSEVRPLGQTPLSEVRVPVGSVLIFRNPGFPEKRHQVIATDRAVQAVFP